MCIPSPRASALPASNIPSMQAASGIDLGGAGTAAAGLGRLKLRGGSATTQVPKAVAPVAPTASSQVGLGGSVGGAQNPNFQNVPNAGLRLPTSTVKLPS